MFLILFSFLFSVNYLFAAGPFNIENENKELSSEIVSSQYAKIGESIIFQANIYNFDLEEQYLEFEWDFGDNYYESGKEVSHVFRNVGEYLVTLKINDREHNLISSSEHRVRVAKEMFLLVNDKTIDNTKIEAVISSLRENDNIVFNITYQDEENFIKNLEQHYSLKQIDALILMADDLSFYNSLLNVIQEDLFVNVFLAKPIIIVNERNFNIVGSILNNIKEISQSSYIILLKDYLFIKSLLKDGSAFVMENVYQIDGDYQIIGLNNGALPWYRPMSKAINQMVKHGIPLQNIWILLSLMLIATVIVFTRQVIGLRALGIYTPTLLAVSFLMTGFLTGIIFFTAVLFVGIIIRKFAKKLRILYMPKMAFLLIAITLAVFMILTLGAYWDKTGLFTISILPLVIMIMLTEKFLSIHFEFSSKDAWRITLETIFLAILAYFIVSWDALRLLILAYPEFILLTIPFNIILGRWSGLRLLEYFRFYKVIHKEMEEMDLNNLVKKESDGN